METPAGRTELVSAPLTQEAPEEGHKGNGIVSPVQTTFTGGQAEVATVLPVLPVPKAPAKSQTSGTTVSPVQEALEGKNKVALCDKSRKCLAIVRKELLA